MFNGLRDQLREILPDNLWEGKENGCLVILKCCALQVCSSGGYGGYHKRDAERHLEKRAARRSYSHLAPRKSSCKRVPKQSCQSKPVQKPVKKCKSVPRQSCNQVPRESCKSVSKKSCSQVPVQKPTQVTICHSPSAIYPTISIIIINIIITISITISNLSNQGGEAGLLWRFNWRLWRIQGIKEPFCIYCFQDLFAKYIYIKQGSSLLNIVKIVKNCQIYQLLNNSMKVLQFYSSARLSWIKSE